MNDDREQWRCPVCHSDEEDEYDAIVCGDCDRLCCDGCVSWYLTDQEQCEYGSKGNFFCSECIEEDNEDGSE